MRMSGRGKNMGWLNEIGFMLNSLFMVLVITCRFRVVVMVCLLSVLCALAK